MTLFFAILFLLNFFALADGRSQRVLEGVHLDGLVIPISFTTGPRNGKNWAGERFTIFENEPRAYMLDYVPSWQNVFPTSEHYLTLPNGMKACNESATHVKIVFDRANTLGEEERTQIRKELVGKFNQLELCRIR